MLKYKKIVLTKEYVSFLNNKDEIIEKYFSKGYTAKELSEEYNFNRICFPNYLKKEGLKTRGRGEPTSRQINKLP